MPKFQKVIATPGTYEGTDMVNGGRAKQVQDAARLKEYARKFNEMRAAGLEVPAPAKHLLNVVPVDATGKASMVGSKANFGFWEKLEVNEKNELVGTVDVPLDADAEMVGKTVCATSPMIHSEWTDGSGKVWKDVITHIALVNQPIEKGQQNFVPVLAMAHEKGFDELTIVALGANNQDDGSAKGPQGDINARTATIKDALAILQQCGLKLPPDTTPENLVEYIVVAGGAVAAANGGDDDDEKELENKGKKEPNPIAMSHSTGDDEVKNEHLLAFATTQVRNGYKARLDNLVATGRLSAKIRKDKFDPQVEVVALSFNDETGEPQATMVDTMLEALEALPANPLLKQQTAGNTKGTTKKVIGMAQEEELPEGYEGEDNAMDDKAIDDYLASAGMSKW